MNPVDLAFTPALEQAALIRHGEISPLELTQLYLERIERLNPILGSYFVVMADQAIADARAKTELLAQRTISSASEGLPPFFGVPISIKDLSPVLGAPCSYGVGILKNRPSTEDAGIVTKIREAGFVILGKTATSELGSTPYTEPRGFPPARNPWNPDYTPGGSSGGAAASVAAGLSPVAHGSDGGGSIRGPAACCGLVGIKPARGRVSHAPLGDKLSGLAIDGPFARTVSDAAALLDVLAGYVPGDPYWLPDPPQSFLSATQQSVKTLRIAFTTNIPPVGKFHPVYEQTVLDTVALLEELGHQVEPIELDFTELAEPLIKVWQAGVDMGVPWIFLGKLNRWLLRRSRSNSGGVYLRALMQMQSFARRLVVTLDPIDVLVLPIFMHPVIRVGEWAPLRAAKQFEKIVNWVAPCPPFNATGQPAIALPMGLDPNGLPIGIQFIGRPADETTLISLAAQIEQAKPWIHRRPALCAE
ncbi:amidase [Oscillatoria sp. FACHB-1407]|uniref:amidase n=1 Tax=Oscillatoria sp. FACHB-1407 TaxID=2692847 RepID=UPI0016863E63|nr:amidase [Oscillatoria sp. FACHB-1407]MBD2462764.1 amidase [Oscillatoria sp. FACHB-1407]